jgi:hypothetical protein
MDKVEYARHWYTKGVCPGCGTSLELVAGRGYIHYKPGQRVKRASGIAITEPGETRDSYGSLKPYDNRICNWTGDDLAALVHIGSGMVLIR